MSIPLFKARNIFVLQFHRYVSPQARIFPAPLYNLAFKPHPALLARSENLGQF